jgi:hypothetical protein
MEVSGQSCPDLFAPWERAPNNNWVGVWVGPGASLDAVEYRKNLSPARNQTVAAKYVTILTELFQLFSHSVTKEITSAKKHP